MYVERAIFTSAETDAGAGYQLVARSDGLSAVDLRALCQWGPSHDSLCESRGKAASVNFHPLPSGAACVSQTMAGGAEYSGRAGPRIETQCLVVSPELLARFGANPFSLLTAVRAQGSLAPAAGATLRRFTLAGRASPFNQTLLSRMVRTVGADFLATAIEAALDGRATVVIADCDRDQLVEAILNLLPVECRAELTFATGLRLSDRRPFRLAAIARDGEEPARARRREDMLVLDQADPQTWPRIESSWARMIHDALAGGHISRLANAWRKPRPGATLDNLAQYAEGLSSAELPPSLAPVDTTGDGGSGAAKSTAMAASAAAERRADSPHVRPGRSSTAIDAHATADVAINDPSRQLGLQRPDVVERLELLDDTVFEAIAGKSAALERLRTLWPETLAALGRELVEESRDQYIRHAMQVWQECAGDTDQRNPRLAINAAEVVALLLGD